MARDVYVGLLRGVNVGGNNKLPMKDLAAMVEEAGGEEVRTYIQSGNVVFRAAPKVARAMPDRVSAAILERHGFNTPVVLRSAAALRAVRDNNPYLKAGAPEDKLIVLFLKDTPTPEAVASLDPNRWPPDEFMVVGAEVYAHFRNGMGCSKLTNAYFDSRLRTVSTARNLRTLDKLIALTED
jgi:uncharacterized protein (DUF1697 family)